MTAIAVVANPQAAIAQVDPDDIVFGTGEAPTDPPPMTAPVESSDSCPDVADVGALDASGVLYVTCASATPPPAEEAAAAAATGFAHAPSWCSMGWAILKTRHSACTMAWVGVTAYQSGSVVGNLRMEVATWNTMPTRPARRNWRQYAEARVPIANGVFATGASGKATLQCGSEPQFDCHPTGTTINWPMQIEFQALRVGSTFYGYQDFASDGPGRSYDTPGLWITLQSACCQPSSFDWNIAGWQIRCDNSLPNYPAGCVYWEWDRNWYTLSTSDTRVQEVARHVQRAQQLIPNHVGRWADGVPMRRTQNETEIDANRKAACGTFVAIPMPPGEPRDSCDEYPFASTKEGAARAQPGYSSTAHVPHDQNSIAGSWLGTFYYDNRILHNDPFYARIL